MTGFQHSAAISSRPGANPARAGDIHCRAGVPLARRDRQNQLLTIRSLLMACLLALFQAVPALAADAAPPAALNINTASAEALADGLERIGPVRAQAIVTWREKNGKFTSVEQLSAVPGVGAAVVELNRDRIAID